MPYVPYNFPDFGNASTRQQTNALMDGVHTSIEGYRSSAGVAQNATPNPYAPSGTIAPYGSNLFSNTNGYGDFGQSQNINHLEINQKIDEPLLFRRNPGVPERDARGYRIRTTSVNAPPINSAQFNDGTGKGDIYGA